MAVPNGLNTEYDSFYSPYNAEFYASYQYNALNRKGRHVRLLKVFGKKTYLEHLDDHREWKRIRPKLSDTQKLLACEMVDGVPLSRCTGQYLALSYAAGDPTDTKCILVGGHVFNAFAQLAHALECALGYCRNKYLDQDGYCLFWVDQICINQSDLEERGHQVMMMRDIYFHCATTIVCLSSTTDQLDMDDVRRAKSEDIRGFAWLDRLSSSMSLVDLLWSECAKRSSPLIQSYLKFLRSPWWKRSWVYQEFVASPEVLFVFGREVAAWEGTLSSAKVIRDVTTLPQQLASRLNKQSVAWTARAAAVDEWPNIWRHQELFSQRKKAIRKMFMNNLGDLISREVYDLTTSVGAKLASRPKEIGTGGDLRVLLRHARNFQASDARDKVYAFVGLTHNAYRFEPDYSPENTVEAVYCDAAHRILRHHRDLIYILEQAWVGRLGREQGLYLPSWVPDWNGQEDRSVLEELESYCRKSTKTSNIPTEPRGDVSVSNLLKQKSSVQKLARAWKDLCLRLQQPQPNEPNLCIGHVAEASGERPMVKVYRNAVDEGKAMLRVNGRHVVTLAQAWTVKSKRLWRFECGEGIAVAPSTARPNDEIWDLVACNRFVVLRHEEGNKFLFGGFAVIGGFEGKLASTQASTDVFLI